MIYAVDIDGTLCEDGGEDCWLNYGCAKPLWENIRKINYLYNRGDNVVVLYTSRLEEDKEVTQRWLSEHNVKYHRLIMEKFRADIYVDSAAKRPEEL